MPELPEVETVRRGLIKFIVGYVVESVNYDWDKSFPNAKSDVNEFLIGAEILQVRRRAKVLLIDLSTEYTLVIHLKMTGQLVFVSKNLVGSRSQIVDSNHEETLIPNYDLQSTKNEVRFGAGHPNNSLVGSLPDKSTRVIFYLHKTVRGSTSHSRLFFNDQRKFGWVRLYPTVEVPNIDFMQKVGPEPLESEFTAKILFDRLQRRKNTTIKAAILDQTVLAGVGNIYADESLWGAKIHPASLVKDVSFASVKKLYTEIRFVMNLAIEKGGSSDRNYINAEGKRGSYLSFARVFRREGQPCPRCGTTIAKTRVAGRGTHACPNCQKKLTK